MFLLKAFTVLLYKAKKEERKEKEKKMDRKSGIYHEVSLIFISQNNM